MDWRKRICFGLGILLTVRCEHALYENMFVSVQFARPRTMNEGLFCVQEPEARCELTTCGNCGLCYPRYNRKHRSKKSVVEFSHAHKHTFGNGYEATLNCSAIGSLWPLSLSLSNHVDLPYVEHRLSLDLSVSESGLYRCEQTVACPSVWRVRALLQVVFNEKKFVSAI